MEFIAIHRGPSGEVASPATKTDDGSIIFENKDWWAVPPMDVRWTSWDDIDWEENVDILLFPIGEDTNDSQKIVGVTVF